MMATYEQKRAIAVWLARAWAAATPIILFSCVYFGLLWVASSRGYEASKAICAIIAGAVVLLNSREMLTDLLRSLRYPLVKK